MAKTNLARKMTRTPAFRTCAVSLDPDIAAKYEAQEPDRDIGAILSDRLEDALVVAHTSEKPLYFTDDQRRELETLLAYNFNDAEQVIGKLKSLFTVIKLRDGADSEDLVLDPNQAFRLAERARMAGISVPQLALRLANRGINTEIGLY